MTNRRIFWTCSAITAAALFLGPTALVVVDQLRAQKRARR